MKAAADALNKQLPKEVQGGSIQPLVEEQEEGEGQPIDTFSSEIDSFDQVNHPLEGDAVWAALFSLLLFSFA